MTSHSPARFEHYLVAGLLALYWVMAITGSLRKSNAFDEMAHLTGGYSYLETGEYRLHPENGVLPQKWAALPLRLMSARFPSTNQPAWWHSDLWTIGFQFLFQIGNDADQMLFASRSMIAILGMALGLVIYFWSRSLFGPRGGLISLVLFAFCPHFLAHGALVTSDIPSTLFLTLSTWTFWRLLEKFTIARLLLAALSISALILSKATSLTLIPIAFLMIAVRGALGYRTVNWRKVTAALAVIAGTALILMWAFYSFRYSAFRDPEPDHQHFTYSWNQVLAHPVAPVFRALRSRHILPEAYLFGTSLNFVSLRSRGGFINGKYSYEGFWYYFPYCFLVKTPLPFFIILLLAAMVALKRPISVERAAPLWILFAVYWFFALTSRVDIGHRYILPVYPVLYILAGSSVAVFQKQRKLWSYLLIACLGWFVGESIFIRPNYLAYFNELVGGPRQGYKHLVDSSLDWGQDLPALQEWLEANHRDSRPVYLAYFGTASPQYYGVNARPLVSAGRDQPLPPLEPGIYCVSSTLLQTMYTTVMGPWAVPYEKTYRQLLQKQTAGKLNPEDVIALERYRFARLCSSLRKRNPDAEAGYSILIYNLSRRDLERALYGSPVELESDIRVKGLINGKIPPFL